MPGSRDLFCFCSLNFGIAIYTHRFFLRGK